MTGITTDTYPTRYVAFDNPGVWVGNSEFHMSPGYEFAAYHEPMQNSEYPYLTDGIYCEIACYQGKDFLLSCHYTTPDQHRRQSGLKKRYREYHEARKVAHNWIAEAQGKPAAE